MAHLAEVDPALAILALWCRHAETGGMTQTRGDTIRYGPGFARLALPEQVGLLAHHVLHVALRHSDRQAAMGERLGARFDASLFGLAADGIVNQTLVLAGHALPRPAVLLTDLLDEVGLSSRSPIEALTDWDAERLSMTLQADEKKAQKARDYGQARSFAHDLASGNPADQGEAQSAADWRNQMLRALEAGRKAGTGIGRFGAILADLAPARVPWEVQLRGLLARALTEEPRPSNRRPSGRWVAMAAEAAASGRPVPVFQPGRHRNSDRPRVALGVDTSSSIDPVTLSLFLAEAEGVSRRSGAEVHLLAFDEAVHHTERLDTGGWANLRDRRLRTGGGTDFTDLFAAAGRLAPSILIVLTDLDAPVPAAPGYPVIWAVPAEASAPYGRVLRIGD